MSNPKPKSNGRMTDSEPAPGDKTFELTGGFREIANYTAIEFNLQQPLVDCIVVDIQTSIMLMWQMDPSSKEEMVRPLTSRYCLWYAMCPVLGVSIPKMHQVLDHVCEEVAQHITDKMYKAHHEGLSKLGLTPQVIEALLVAFRNKRKR